VFENAEFNFQRVFELFSKFEGELTNMVNYFEYENKVNEHSVLKDIYEYCENINTRDDRTPKLIALIEKDTKILMGDPNYNYEFALIHYGGLIYASEELTALDSDSNYMIRKLKSVSPEIQNLWENDGQWLWFKVMHDIFNMHKKYHEDALKSIHNKALIAKLNNLLNKPYLFEKKEYQYEFFLTVMGTEMHAKKETVEIIKQIQKSHEIK
jgi:predicted HNH restriction endonuclease